MLQHWVDWKLRFINYFIFLSFRLSQSHDPVGGLTWVESNQFFFLILSFNIELIRNYDSYFVLICFL
jgi:hypothetical protein